LTIARSAVQPAIPGSASIALVLALGCQPAPPPPRVPVPSDDRGAPVREREAMRPLPPPNSYDEPNVGPPFDDVPLVAQRPPEQRAFVEAYRNVGSPRVAVFVVGQQGDANTAAIDYEAVETIMSDWLACDGQVSLMAPSLATRRLGESEERATLAQLGADVAVTVRAATTPSSRDGKSLRLVAQAVNTRDGDSIGRAVVDVPPPLEKSQINDYTRFLARKLMDDMSQTWRAASPQMPLQRRADVPATGSAR
jgi:hypothetical protein